MVEEIYRRPYRVRRAAARGKEITIPSDMKLEPGDIVVAFYDGFVLYVPKGAQVDEALLRQAISVRPEAVPKAESVRKLLPEAPEAPEAEDA